jgi:hypothetical protein
MENKRIWAGGEGLSQGRLERGSLDSESLSVWIIWLLRDLAKEFLAEAPTARQAKVIIEFEDEDDGLACKPIVRTAIVSAMNLIEKLGYSVEVNASATELFVSRPEAGWRTLADTTVGE